MSGVLEEILIAKSLFIDGFSHLAMRVKGLGGKLPDCMVLAQ